MFIKTKNSIYEIETSTSVIRRITPKEIKKLTGITSDWRPYSEIIIPALGGNLFVVFENGMYTRTTKVLAIQNSEFGEDNA